MSPDQPFSVSCFVLLSAEQEQQLHSEIEQLRREYSKLIVKELKFAKLGKTTMGLGAVRKIGLALKRVGARVFFSISEKRYFACFLLSETFFDADLNPAAPPEQLVPGYRRWLTNKLHEVVPERLLQDLMTAIRVDNVDATRRVGEDTARLLRLHPDAAVAAEAERLFVGLREFHRFGTHLEGAPIRSERPSPAVAELGVLLSAIDQELAECGQFARIVSDVDRQFGESLNFSLALVKNPACFDADGFSHYGVRGPCTRILDRVEVSSETSLGVQLADIGAGIISRAAGEASGGRELEPGLRNAWEPFQRMLQRNPHCTWWRVSEQCLKKLLKPFSGVCPQLDPV